MITKIIIVVVVRATGTADSRVHVRMAPKGGKTRMSFCDYTVRTRPVDAVVAPPVGISYTTETSFGGRRCCGGGASVFFFYSFSFFPLFLRSTFDCFDETVVIRKP